MTFLPRHFDLVLRLRFFVPVISLDIFTILSVSLRLFFIKDYSCGEVELQTGIIMAYDGAGDVNVFLTPRVAYPGEPPIPHPHPQTSSLLTFADMVIALDSRGNVGSDIQGLECSRLDSELKADHTYASLRESRVMTRSQTLRTTNCPSPSSCIDISSTETAFSIDNSLIHQGSSDIVIRDSCHINENIILDEDSTFPHKNYRRKGRHRSKSQRKVIIDEQSSEWDDYDSERIVKRSSSVENVTNQTDSDIAESSEWPQLSKKYTPRKSCSFEEVNHEITSSKDMGHKGGSSGQLHRLVNDTIEFPCWPRKADHTYATATWDGTAASHNLFDKEMHQDIGTDSKSLKSESQHQAMEVTETYIFPMDVRHSDVKNYSHQLTPALFVQNLCDSNKGLQTNQKDDHTYVKHNSNISSSGAGPSDGISVSNFSFATFPRQKTREDHTYFHSGMIRRGSSTSGAKELTSTQSVSELPIKKDHQLSGSRNVDFSLQSVSTKKDHNYSTST